MLACFASPGISSAPRWPAATSCTSASTSRRARATTSLPTSWRSRIAPPRSSIASSRRTSAPAMPTRAVRPRARRRRTRRRGERRTPRRAGTAMSTATVAGVAVSTDHFIDGKRVASNAEIRGVLADRRQASRRYERRRRERDRGRRRRCAPRVSGVGRARPRRTAPDPEAFRAGDPRSRAGNRGGRDRGQRIAADRKRRARDSARRAQHRVLRRSRAAAQSRDDRFAGGGEPRALRSRRRRRADHAVERAVHADDLEGRSGARRRRHGGREAAGVGAADLLDAGRSRDRGRACRPASST